MNKNFRNSKLFIRSKLFQKFEEDNSKIENALKLKKFYNGYAEDIMRLTLHINL